MLNYIQLIGEQLQAQCPLDTKKALLYAEVEDGAISLSIFFTSKPSVVEFRYAADKLEELVYGFWESGQQEMKPKSWCAIEYVIIGTKLDVNFTFPEHFDNNEGEPERRPRVIARHFPNHSADYSNPGE